MDYLAVSYEISDELPVNENLRKILLLLAQPNEGMIAPTLEDGGDLPIRNMLIEHGVIEMSDLMLPGREGVYPHQMNTLVEIAQKIHDQYNGWEIHDRTRQAGYVALSFFQDDFDAYTRENFKPL